MLALSLAGWREEIGLLRWLTVRFFENPFSGQTQRNTCPLLIGINNNLEQDFMKAQLEKPIRLLDLFRT